MVIVDGDAVVTVDPSGEERKVLSEDGDTPFQPIWAPDGDLVAYANVGDEPGVVVVARNGNTRWEGATDTPPFYMSWAVGSSSLALLRNAGSGLSLDTVRLVKDDATLRITPKDSGAPYYFDWSLSDERIVSHVGGDRLDLVETADGSATSLGLRPGRFQAPEWTEDGVFAVQMGPSLDQVVLIDTTSEVIPLVDVVSPAWLDVSPDGDRMAVQSLAGTVDAVTVGYQAPVAQEDVEVLTSGIAVVDIESGEMTMVSPNPAAAFFWSPDGDRLLLLAAGEETGQARWQVWEDGEVTDGPLFTPDPGWVASFVPFFDQYARSMSLWSPDGDAFAFPGMIDGASGIWVHDLGGGGTNLVSGGSWVAWATP